MRHLVSIGIFCALACGTAWADARPELKLVLENHVFTPDTLQVAAGTPFTLMIENKDDSVDEFDSADLKREKVISGHSTAKIMLSGLKPGIYKFEGEFHAATAQGKIIVK